MRIRIISHTRIRHSTCDTTRTEPRLIIYMSPKGAPKEEDRKRCTPIPSPCSSHYFRLAEPHSPL